jgi:hypothetical protein
MYPKPNSIAITKNKTIKNANILGNPNFSKLNMAGALMVAIKIESKIGIKILEANFIPVIITTKAAMLSHIVYIFTLSFVDFN